MVFLLLVGPLTGQSHDMAGYLGAILIRQKKTNVFLCFSELTKMIAADFWLFCPKERCVQYFTGYKGSNQIQTSFSGLLPIHDQTTCPPPSSFSFQMLSCLTLNSCLSFTGSVFPQLAAALTDFSSYLPSL